MSELLGIANDGLRSVALSGAQGSSGPAAGADFGTMLR